MLYVTESKLDDWVRGYSIKAQGLIPELVMRLIRASTYRQLFLHFPHGDSIGQHGPDGILTVDSEFEPFIPLGKSYWEIGVGINAGDKATNDYKELTKSTPPGEKNDSVFIFVTPLSGLRGWPSDWKEKSQLAWIRKRKKQNEWKDVRVIDGNKLCDWISRYPAVESWLTEKIGGPKHGHIESVEQRWEILKSYGEPPSLSPEVFLLNREEACRGLQSIFENSTVELKVQTRYQNQVTDFVSAYIMGLEENKRLELLGRCILVLKPDAWSYILDHGEKLYLITNSEPDRDTIQKARNRRHSVIYGATNGGPPHPSSLQLRSPKPEQLKMALLKIGYSEARAELVSDRSEGNLESFLRLLQNLSSMPEWSQSNEASDLAIAQFVGCWSESSESDRGEVEKLTGKPYGEWMEQIRRIEQHPSTPLIQQDGKWKFISRYEGWYSLGPKLYDSHLERMYEIALSVLCENDPKLDLPKEGRYYASFFGDKITHSSLLRKGIAETLALLGSHPSALTSCTLHKPVSTAILAVRKILSNADWKRWGSLGSLLSLLAEAAPSEFLDAVEEGLRLDPCPFVELFSQEGDGITGESYHCGLLWALETLAWSPEFFARVILIFGELAEKDPGGKIVNRPFNSITSILLPWHRQTCASFEDRKRVVTILLKEHPAIGWEVLIKLMPNKIRNTSNTNKPAWRDFIPQDWDSRYHYSNEIHEYLEIAISASEGNPERLADIVSLLPVLGNSAYEAILHLLKSNSEKLSADEERSKVWVKLIEIIKDHRRYPTADWALGENELLKVVEVAELYQPNRPFFIYQRLFNTNDFQLYEEHEDFDKERQKLQQKRQEAIMEVEKEGGFNSTLEFLKAVEKPWEVGIAYGFVAEAFQDQKILPKLLVSEEKAVSSFSSGFVWSRFHSKGWSWIDQLDTKDWTHSQLGLFLSYLPFQRETWDRAEQLLAENDASYWLMTTANPYDTEPEELEMAVSKLLHHKRSFEAIGCINQLFYKKHEFDYSIAFTALLSVNQALDKSTNYDIHQIEEIIEYLQNSPKSSFEEVANIEWLYLGIFDKYSSKVRPKFLEAKLAAEPSFFCSCLRKIYRSNKSEKEEIELSEEQKSLATNLYKLLDDWSTPPGMDIVGNFDGNRLQTWFAEVKQECEETGHWESAMSRLGHVLVNAPPDPDGLWIHRSAAEVLNSKDAQNIRDGFGIEILNSRGAHWVDPSGQPELGLAAKYNNQAVEVEKEGYHRLAITMRKLSEQYEREAERNILRANSEF